MRHRQLADISMTAYEHLQYEVADVEFMRESNVFAFRGTDEAADVLRDIRALPWWTKGLGWCPAGFVKAAEPVLIKLMSIALKENLSMSQIVLTGHSLGGAIAIIVGAKLALLGHPVQEIVTFGTPRCGRLKVLDKTNVTMYRNGKDVVPQLPPLMRRHKKPLKIGVPGGWLADHKMRAYCDSLRR